MPKKMRRVRTFARTATKSQEKHLVDNAKKLTKDPFIILPDCTNNCEKYFKKTRSKIEKIHKFNDDLDKLEKIANKKGLEGALAGTLLLASSEKAPYLGVVKFPTGDITYAQRGKAEKEKLIAVQHFDDPVLRLMGIRDIAQKKGLHVYSWDEGYVCTGQSAEPPTDFNDFIISKLKLTQKNNISICKHLNPEQIQQSKPLKKYYLRINWKPTNRIIALCEECSKTSKNTIFNLTKYILTPNLSDEFDIDVIAEVIKQDNAEFKTEFKDEYLSGKLNDHEFILKNVNKQEKQIKESDERVFVLDGTSYGSDSSKFLDELKPNKNERDCLEYILSQIQEPLVLSQVTPNKVLEMHWKTYGLEYIKTIIDDEELADSFYHLDDTPSDILKTVFDYKKRRQILAQLPVFKSLPPLAEFADHVARTYRTFGEKQTLTEIKKRPDNPKAKSIAYAFLLALGKGTDLKWKYSQVEIEYGEFLQEYAKKLLDADPKKYKTTLQELLTASGSSEEI